MMRKLLFFVVLLIAVAVLVGGVAQIVTASPAPQTDEPADPAGYAAPAYVGTDSCQECHEDTYNTFMKSGHPYKLNKVIDGQPPTYPYSEVTDTPEGYTWDDILYVIGGYGWKARFIDKEGYIITGADEDAKTQYNFYNEDIDMGDNWVGYHAGQENVPYDCGSCHTTGYSPDGHQDDVPGLIGTWVADGVQCEECHGPASNHVNDPMAYALPIDRDSELCGQCHIRDGVTEINASGGFIKHHEQYEEAFQSKKRGAMRCVDCHDPHETVKYAKGVGQKTDCESCHLAEEKYQKITDRTHAECIDCHMPRASKSALGDPERYTGDLRTHIFAINPDQIGQFTEDGSASLSYLGLDFACKSCHYDGGPASVETDEDLIDLAVGYHERDQIGSLNDE